MYDLDGDITSKYMKWNVCKATEKEGKAFSIKTFICNFVRSS